MERVGDMIHLGPLSASIIRRYNTSTISQPIKTYQMYNKWREEYFRCKPRSRRYQVFKLEMSKTSTFSGEDPAVTAKTQT